MYVFKHTSQGEFMLFHFETDFVIDIKVVSCIVLYILVKFGDNRRSLTAAPTVVAGRSGAGNSKEKEGETKQKKFIKGKKDNLAPSTHMFQYIPVAPMQL